MTIVIIIKEKLQTESMKVLSEKKDSSRQVILAKWNGDLKKGGGLNTAPRGAENTDGSYAIKGSDEDEGLTPVREYKLQRWSSAEMSAFSNDNKKWRTHAQNGKAQHVKTWKKIEMLKVVGRPLVGDWPPRCTGLRARLRVISSIACIFSSHTTQRTE